jgi:para-aminobenzoate synthetase/4-amino-4-deoxychorismate lyase
MKVIAELEATRRELYTGAIGIASPLAGLDLAVAIRTFEFSGEEVWIGVGGGIVADSDPEEELTEALDKARGPLSAVGGLLAGGKGVRLRPAANLPRALDYGERPDPVRGVFETILLEDGHLHHLDRHLQRLSSTALELYGVALPEDIEQRAQAVVAGFAGRARVRIALKVPIDTITLSREAPVSSEPLQLAPFLLPGGLGAYKWRDRDLLDALTAASGAVPLLIDGDGSVLEAAYANVWIIEGDQLITPPADGRILPGVTRAALLAAERSAGEEPISYERLRAADGIFLTSAISGRRVAHLR